MDREGYARRYVAHFDELEPAKGAPPDIKLPRFARDRFMLLGRNSEREAGQGASGMVTNVNLAYVRCDPGKGFCSHKHPSWEIFVPLSGRWKIVLDGREPAVLDRWDVMVLPGDLYHGAENISASSAVMMSINPGEDTASFTIAPEVLAEIGEAARSKAMATGMERK